MNRLNPSQYCPANNALANVLVFDSGVGGLSITQEIIARLPQVNITYAADNAAFPYGIMQENNLIHRVDQILHRFQEITRADLIVVACNTASTIALPALRQRFSVPIVGVVPAIKPAAKISESKVIGLLATPGTVARQYTQNLIDEFAGDCQVITLGSRLLVEMAEQKLSGVAVCPSALREELKPLLDANQQQLLDTIVLACTHFPLLKKELTQCAPSIKHWVDSGEAIARRVQNLLEDAGWSVNNGDNVATPIYQTILTQSPKNAQFLEDFLHSWFSRSWSMLTVQ